MIRKVADTVVALECECVPDVNAARMLFPEAEHASDDLLCELLWARMGSSDENPRPILPVMQCRLITMAMVVRKKGLTQNDPPEISLVWMPRNLKNPEDERTILTKFLKAMERHPLLVGYNIKESVLHLLQQRAMVLGIQSAEDPSMLSKSVLQDYFAKENEYSVDLKELIIGNGSYKTDATFDDLCILCGIPGKLDNHGAKILDFWLAGEYEKIVRYNCYNAISNYLLWLRLSWMGGCYSTRQYETEKALLHEHLMMLSDRHDAHFLQLDRYIHEWDRLQDLHERFYSGAQ